VSCVDEERASKYCIEELEMEEFWLKENETSLGNINNVTYEALKLPRFFYGKTFLSKDSTFLFRDTIIFNQDSTKLIGLFISKNAETNFVHTEYCSGYHWSYSGNSIIGYIEKEKWRIYPLEIYLPRQRKSPFSTRESHHKYYFNELKHDSFHKLKQRNNDLNYAEWELIDYKYNITDMKFWDSPLWTLSELSIENRVYYLYPFEINGKPSHITQFNIREFILWDYTTGEYKMNQIVLDYIDKVK
jgi:hypothetical protein